jgi:hypothetical protein
MDSPRSWGAPDLVPERWRGSTGMARLVQIQRLAFPELMIEIKCIAKV